MKKVVKKNILNIDQKLYEVVTSHSTETDVFMSRSFYVYNGKCIDGVFIH